MNKVIRDKSGKVLAVQLMFHDEKGQPLDEILTKQCFKDECDINNIIRKYQKTGVLPPLNDRVAYGDFSDVGNYQDALIKLQEADEMFDSLPAQLRARFDNDTAKFLDYVDNPTNLKEMYELGLVDKNCPGLDLNSVTEVKVSGSGEQSPS